MKILILDDTTIHLEAAEAQLGTKHDLTVVRSYNEALALLSLEDPETGRSSFHDYEAVLCDLLMPAEDCGVGMMPEAMKFLGQEMPVGVFIALVAARRGCKYVAILSDVNHHFHPASACLDPFCDYSDGLLIFDVGGAKALFTNRDYLDYFHPTDLSKRIKDKPWEVSWEDFENQHVKAKNWSRLLAKLMDS